MKGKETDETSNASMETADSLANEVDQNSLRSTGQDLQEGPIYSYELVQEVEIDYTRPVVILAIFLKPKSPAFIMSVNDRMSDEQAEKSFNRAVRLEQDFLQYFTSIVDGEKFEDIYEKVKSVIKSHSKTRIWVSANEMF